MFPDYPAVLMQKEKKEKGLSNFPFLFWIAVLTADAPRIRTTSTLLF